MLAGLAGFSGARRRFEVRGEVDGVTVVDDYAHNPAKVAAVVGHGIRDRAPRRHGSLRVVFQPHLYSRTRDFADAFAGRAVTGRPGRHRLDVYGARERPRRRASAARWSPTRCATCPGRAPCSSARPREQAVAALVAPPGPATSCSRSVPAT